MMLNPRPVHPFIRHKISRAKLSYAYTILYNILHIDEIGLILSRMHSALKRKEGEGEKIDNLEYTFVQNQMFGKTNVDFFYIFRKKRSLLEQSVAHSYRNRHRRLLSN